MPHMVSFRLFSLINKGAFDGLQPARHFLDGLRLGTVADVQDLASIQSELFSWYTSHSLKVQADFLANCSGQLNINLV